jgi:hypothetical protein
MYKPIQFVIRFMLILGLVSNVLAQDLKTTGKVQSTAPIITAFASSEKARFTAPASVVQIRLEVYSSTGKKVFDNEVRGGNVLDWYLQNGQAERLADDTYLCVLTVKNLSGKISQRIGSVLVEKSAASVQAVAASQMTTQQSEAIGPLEEDASFVVWKEDERQTPTVIAHNGEEGQITRGRGALSFRLGDFYGGKDAEQMRLTAEGNLGIGITNPQARLDVGGQIRASEGIVFPDGSVQFSAATKTFGTVSQKPGQFGKHPSSGQEHLSPQATAAGTQDRLAKWTDNAGTLGDSAIVEVNGNIGIGTTSPQSGLDYRSGSAAFFSRNIPANPGTAQSALQLGLSNVGSRNAGVGPSFLFFGENSAGAKSFLGRVSGVWENPAAGGEAGAIFFQVRANSGDVSALTERMRIKANGHVGIGDVAPTFRLHVVDSGNTGLRVQTNTGGGTLASFGGFGDFLVDAVNVVGGRLSVKENGNVGLGTNSPQARLDVRGNVKLGSSGQYFAPGGEENLRIIRGVIRSDGAIIAGSGFQASRTGFGEYLITFNTPFAEVPAVTVTPERFSSSPSTVAQTEEITANSVKIRTVATLPGDDIGDPFNNSFHFIAIGPR